MSKKRNDLTREQELFLRDIIERADELGIPFPADIIMGFMSRMGYRVLPNGAAVRADLEVKTIFGDPDPYRKFKDEYYPDGEILRELEALESKAKELGFVSTDDSDTDTPSPSESPESDPVGDVLLKDV